METVHHFWFSREDDRYLTSELTSLDQTNPTIVQIREEKLLNWRQVWTTRKQRYSMHQNMSCINTEIHIGSRLKE